MRHNCKNLVKIAARTLSLTGPVYEFGSFLVEGQEELANLRPIFPGFEYLGCDMRAGPGVDRILNLHQLDLADASAGTIICLDTMEHVEFPRRAMDEMYRVLKPGGTLIMTSVMNFPIHNYPYDYWRFTPEGFLSLMGPFPTRWVCGAGAPDFPHTLAAIGVKATDVDLSAFAAEGAQWAARQRGELEHIISSLTPPLLLPAVEAAGRVLYRALGKR